MTSKKRFTNEIGIDIIQNNNLPILIENEAGELETYHMIQKGDAIYVSERLYSSLLKRNGMIL